MSRDEDIYREEITAHLGAIRSQVRRVARSCDEADELTQECVARLLEKERLYQRKGPIAHWISVVVRRFALNRVRKRRTWERKKVEVTSMDAFPEQEPPRDYSEDDIRTVLQQFVHLTPAQREVLQLKYFEGLSRNDIAERLGITPQAVSQRVGGAVRRLRDRARYAQLAPWLVPFAWFQDTAAYALAKGWKMFGSHKLAGFGLVSLLVIAFAGLSWGDGSALATISDAQGLAHRKGVTADRWSAVHIDDVLDVGDWLKTSARGANLVALSAADGAALILGPGSLLEVTGAAGCTLSRGVLDVGLAGGGSFTVTGPGGASITLAEDGVVRATETGLERLEGRPKWLVDYVKDRPEALGELLTMIDGRNVALSIGYHKVTVDIRDQIARTVIEQSFINHTDHTLEGDFAFPLPAGASVSSFGMWIGGELVEGDIVERERARQIYEQIKREDEDPGLLEWEGGNIFRAKVYPIHREKRIRIAYTQVLPKSGDGYRYAYRLKSELLRRNPLAELAIEVSIASTQALAGVTSPSHTMRSRVQEHTATLDFSAEEHTPERDFQLDIRTVPGAPITFVPHLRDGDGYFLLWLDGPEAKETKELPAKEPQSFVLLADTSASMDPGKRAQQAAFIDALLSSLSKEDRFNLAVSDYDTVFAFDAPRPVTDASIAEALGFLGARHSLGWTDLDAGVKAAAGQCGPGAHLVYVGDAIPTTGDAEPAAAAERLGRLLAGRDVRVHAVSVGTSYEDRVLKALAAHGGGLHQVEDRAGALSAASALLARIVRPVLRDVTVSIEGIETAAVYPASLGSLPAGQQLCIVGRYLPGSVTGPATVVMRGSLDGAPVEHVATVSVSEGDRANSFIPRLWARNHLEHLLDQVPNAVVRERIVGLSEDFQIMTPYTSILVLESDAQRERFAVERSFRMRDGEEFFAEGRDLAYRELVREQMRLAAGWRLQLKKQYFDHFAQLGEHAAYSFGGGGGVGGGLVVPETATRQSGARLGSSRGRGSPRDQLREEEKSTEQNLYFDGDAEFLGAPAPSASPAPMAPPAELAADEALNFRANSRDGIAERRLEAGYEVVAGLAASDAYFAGEYKQAMLGRAFMPVQPSYLLGLFPSVGAPATAYTGPRWSDELRERLAPFSRRALVRTGDGGWRFGVESFRMNKRDVVVPTASATHLLGAERWAVASSAPYQASTLRWFGDGSRVSVDLSDQLGRHRPGEEGDAEALPVPFSALWFTPLDELYGRYEPTLRDEDGRLVLALAQDDVVFLELVFDEARSCLVESRSFSAGTLTSRAVYTDLVEVGGATWPGSVDSFDADGRLTRRIRVAVEQLAAADYVAAWEAAIAPGAEALRLPMELPSVGQAKSALDAGSAGLVEQLVLADHHAGIQAWDALWEALDAACARAEEGPGTRRLRREALFFSRRVEAGRQLLIARVAALAAEPPADGLYHAVALLNAAGALQVREQLPLLETLEAVFRAADPRLEAVLEWQLRRAALFQSLGWDDRRSALLTALAEEWPDDLRTQQAYSADLFARRELDAALASVERALERGVWREDERLQLRVQGARMRLDGRRLDDFLRYVAAHEEEVAWDHWTYEQTLAARFMLDRVEEADATIRAWLDSTPERDDQRAWNRQYAAVSHAIAQYWGLYNYRQVDDRFFPALAALCERLADREDLDGIVSRVVTHGTFRSSEIGRTRLRADFAGVRAGLETLAPAALRVRIGRLRNAGFDPEDGGAAWEAVFETVLARWQKDHDIELANIILWYADIDRQLRLRRAELAEQETPVAARNLLNLLLTAPWTEERESEAFGLLASIVDADNPHALLEQSAALAQLVDTAEAGRRQHAEQSSDERNTLSRRALAAQREEWQEAARRALLARLTALAAEADEGFRRSLQLEAAILRVRLGETEGLAAALQADLAALEAPAEPDPLRHAWAARSVDMLAHLAIQPGTDGAAADTLLAIARRRAAAEDTLYDWRFLEVALLVCTDRNAEVEALLAGWLAEEDRFIARAWRVLLGTLYAERGALEEAIAAFEALDADGELGAPEAEMLSGWYLVLERDEASDEARLRSYALTAEWQLENTLWNAMYSVQRSGDGVPPSMDPEVPLMLRAWLRKMSNPSRATYTISQLYRATKDFRLLACLAEGVIGHSQSGIYDYLQNLGQVLRMLEDEATADQLADLLDGLRASHDDALTQRALAFLDFLVARQAATQKQGAEAWTARALASFEAAFAPAWQEGEPALAAQLLLRLGKLPPALAAIQLRELEALYREAPRASDDFPAIALAWAQLSWIYRERERTLAVLAHAVDACRDEEGRVPASAAHLLVNLSSYLKQCGEYLATEELWRGELARDYPQKRRWEHELELFGCFVEAYPGYSVSAGRDAELYAFTRDWLIEELGKRRNESLSKRIVDRFLQLMTRADDHGREVGADLLDFAYRELPPILALYQYRNGQNIVANVSARIEDIVSPREALRFLIERAENEPRWLAFAGQDHWSSHGYRFAQLRAEAGRLGDLSPRLLAIALPALRRDLSLRSFRQWNMFHKNNAYFWSQKADDFARIADEVAATALNDAALQEFCASYLFDGLHRYDAGIELLQGAYARGILAWNGRATLIRYLQSRRRYADSLPIAEALVEDQPDQVDLRCLYILALHHAGPKGSAGEAADTARAHLESIGAWEEYQVAALAQVCLSTELYPRAVELFATAINLRKRYVTLNDWTLSHYYGQQARTLAGLGRLEEAVDAAAGAILTWSRSRSERGEALGALVEILAGAKDLDAYVAQRDARFAESQTGSALIRRALGEAYMTREAWGAATAQFLFALRLTPHDEETWGRLLEACDKAEDSAGAIAALRGHILAAPRNYGLYEQLGERLGDAGRRDEAARAFTSLAEVEPHQSEGHAALARHFASRDLWQAAAEQWEQVIRVRSDEPEGHLGLARALIAGKDEARARAVLQKVLGRDWDERFGDVHGSAIELLRGL